jgi:Regulator of G protein signaling domain
MTEHRIHIRAKVFGHNRDFYDYLTKENDEEGLVLIGWVNNYKLLCHDFYPVPLGESKNKNVNLHSPTKKYGMKDSDFEKILAEMLAMKDSIYKNFLANGSTSKLKFPPHAKEKLVKAYDNEYVHPDVHSEMHLHIMNHLDASKFNSFLKHAESKPADDAPRTSLTVRRPSLSFKFGWKRSKVDLASKSATASLSNLNVSPGSVRDLTDKLESPIDANQDRIPRNDVVKFLKMVIADELDHPYSCHDFLDYLEKNLCSENLLFLNSVDEYKELAQPVFPDDLDSQQSANGHEANILPGMTIEHYQELLATLCDIKDDIFREFLNEDAASEINLTSKTKQNLLELSKNDTLHPDVFNAAYQHVFLMLKDDKFSGFLKSASAADNGVKLEPSHLEEFKDAYQQLLVMIKDDSFVKSAQSSKNTKQTENLLTMAKGRIQNAHMRTDTSTSDALERLITYAKNDDHTKAANYAAIDAETTSPKARLLWRRGHGHSKSDSHQPISATITQQRVVRFARSASVNNAAHQNDAQIAVNADEQTIGSRFNPFKGEGFGLSRQTHTKSRSDITEMRRDHAPKLPNTTEAFKQKEVTRSPTLSRIKLGKVMDFAGMGDSGGIMAMPGSISRSPTMTRLKTSNIAEVTGNTPKDKAGSARSPTSPTLTKLKIGKMLEQVVAGQLKSPHSFQDFYKFLKSEHCEEMLLFLEVINKYRKLSKPAFPYHTSDETPQPVKPADMSTSVYENLLFQLAAITEEISNTYLDSSSPTEVTLDPKIRKRLVDHFERENIHPSAFDEAYEHILETLRRERYIRLTQGS